MNDLKTKDHPKKFLKVVTVSIATDMRHTQTITTMEKVTWLDRYSSAFQPSPNSASDNELLHGITTTCCETDWCLWSVFWISSQACLYFAMYTYLWNWHTLYRKHRGFSPYFPVTWWLLTLFLCFCSFFIISSGLPSNASELWRARFVLSSNESQAGLKISSLQLADEGLYRCEITYLEINEGCPVVQYVNLTVLGTYWVFRRSVATHVLSCFDIAVLWKLSNSTSVCFNNVRPKPSTVDLLHLSSLRASLKLLVY